MNPFLIVPVILASFAPIAPQEIAAQEQPEVVVRSAERDELQLHVYEVNFLVELMFPRLSVWSNATQGGQSRETCLQGTVEALTRGLKTHMSPPWDSKRNVMDHSGAGVLIVSATESQQLWIKKFLDHIRENGIEMLKVDTRLIQVPRGKLKSYGIDPPVASVETQATIDAILLRIAQDPASEIISSPSMGLKSLGNGTISVIQQIAYVKEWNVRAVVPERQMIADPVVDVIQEGLIMNVFATALPGGGHGIDLDLERTSIERPIPTRKIRIATEPEQEVTVSSPEVTKVSLKSTFVLEEGTSVIFATAANDDEHDLLVVITAERMVIEEGEASD
jgi:hypothetical protein